MPPKKRVDTRMTRMVEGAKTSWMQFRVAYIIEVGTRA